MRPIYRKHPRLPNYVCICWGRVYTTKYISTSQLLRCVIFEMLDDVYIFNRLQSIDLFTAKPTIKQIHKTVA